MAPPPSPPPDAPEDTIGGYRLISKLGQGGMGEVWVGEHQRLERSAAIKLLLPAWSSDEAVLERFFIEARATSRIRHPNIVEIVDCGVTPGGRAYIVMELLAGKNLRDTLVETQRAQLPFILSVMQQVAAAVGAAHSQRIVHRDLKPDNVFLVDNGQGAAAPLAKVLDFGIAKLVDREAADVRLTGTGILVGTPAYMSPEQARGRGTIDHRTDIYSLGCILFEMAAGRPPFAYEGLGELIAARLTEDPPPLSSVAPGVPEALERLVARMLARNPDDRIATMAEVQSELAAIAASGAAFTSSPALPLVGRTAVLTPAVPVGATRALSSSSSGLAAPARTTFTQAAGEVTASVRRPPRARGILWAAGALVVLATGAFLVLRPSSSETSDEKTVAPSALPAARPAETVVAPAPAVEAPAAAPAPEPALATPPEPASTAEALQPPNTEPPRPRTRAGRARTTSAAPETNEAVDLDALQDVQDPARGARRRRANAPAPAKDLDALAD